MSGICNQCQQKVDSESILDKYTNMIAKIQSIDFGICEHEEFLVVVINREREEKTRQAHWFTML